MSRHGIDSDGGFSLVEILITIVIVGITFTALLTGMVVTITSSSYQRKAATADTVARDAAEWIKDSTKQPYVKCAGTGTYSFTGMPLPEDEAGRKYSVSVRSVLYWDGVTPSAGSSTNFGPPCSPDKGLQQITIEAQSPDGQVKETVQVLKRIVP